MFSLIVRINGKHIGRGTHFRAPAQTADYRSPAVEAL